MNTKKIVVTGSMGRIGRATVRELKRRGHWVRGFDLIHDSHADESIVDSISNLEAFSRVCAGMEVLIHLAATPDDDDFMSKLLPNNIVGTYNAMESARLGGIKRVILASSGQVVWWQRFTGPLPIDENAKPSPRAWYAAGKVFLEAAGQVYAKSHGMSVVAARLGWCPRDVGHVEELAGTDWGPDVYLSPGDAGRFFACASEAPNHFSFLVAYACSKPVRESVYDMTSAKEILGYEPKDTWPQGAKDDIPGI